MHSGTNLGRVHGTGGEGVQRGEVRVLALQALLGSRAVVYTTHDLRPHQRTLEEDQMKQEGWDNLNTVDHSDTAQPLTQAPFPRSINNPLKILQS